VGISEQFLRSLEVENYSVVEEGSDKGDSVVEHDPGLRLHNLSHNQKNCLIRLGPHQPNLARFASDVKDIFYLL